MSVGSTFASFLTIVARLPLGDKTFEYSGIRDRQGDDHRIHRVSPRRPTYLTYTQIRESLIRQSGRCSMTRQDGEQPTRDQKGQHNLIRSPQKVGKISRERNASADIPKIGANVSTSWHSGCRGLVRRLSTRLPVSQLCSATRYHRCFIDRRRRLWK